MHEMVLRTGYDVTVVPLPQGIGWRDIEVTRGKGAPTVHLFGATKRFADGLGVRHMHVSPTHTAEFAVAY